MLNLLTASRRTAAAAVAIGALAAMLAPAGAALARPSLAQDTGTAAQWVHVRVQEHGGGRVSVNLPISLLEVALEIAAEHAGRDGHGIHLGDDEGARVDQLRRAWAELRQAGDAEYIDVTEDDRNVRVYRRGEVVFIEVDEDNQRQVRMRIPFSVVDVLLGGEDGRLDLVGALRELAHSNGGEIVQVTDDDADVRIWIDTSPAGQE